MEIENCKSMGPTVELYRELKQLDLLENIAELDVFGYTIEMIEAKDRSRMS